VAQDASLVARNQTRLNLAGAELALKAAKEKAAEMKLKVNIAVVDDGGHLLAFARLDGARPASLYTAISKATSSATLRGPTGPVPAGVEKPDPLLNLSVQNTAMMSGGKFTTLYGGVPIVVDGQVIGALGVGGASGEQDAEIAKAGAEALVAAIAKDPK
jgi:glc operon protein GlcG